MTTLHYTTRGRILAAVQQLIDHYKFVDFRCHLPKTGGSAISRFPRSGLSYALNDLCFADVVRAVVVGTVVIGSDDGIGDDLTSAAARLAGLRRACGWVHPDIRHRDHRHVGDALDCIGVRSGIGGAAGLVGGGAGAAGVLLLAAAPHELAAGLAGVGQRHRLTLNQLGVASQHVHARRGLVPPSGWNAAMTASVSAPYCTSSKHLGHHQYRKLQRGIKGVLAECESDETSQRTYKRHRYRAQKGMWRGGHPPYGVKPDGRGWLEPDPEAYPFLLWILERRAESQGHHMIAKALNAGIDAGNRLVVPPTPSMLAYRRKPYLERQDPEAGDVIHLPRPLPATTWHKQTVEHICCQAVDGVYAGILNWGHRHNRFLEDMDGNVKTPVSVDTGRPLVPLDLLERVRERVVPLTHD